MLEQQEVQKLLIYELQERKLKNPSYSLRAFAKSIGLGPSTLSEVIQGKRRVSRDAVEKIALRLGLDPKESQKILSQFQSRRKLRRKRTGQPLQLTSLNMDEYYLIADWHYFAILSLTETTNFKSEPEWISARLGITKTAASSAIKRLLKQRLLAKNEKGFLKLTGQGVTTTDGIVSHAIRKNHHQTLDLAKQSLVSDPVDVRNFTAMTMAIDPDLLPEAFKRMNDFRDELCSFLESGSKKEVYKLSLQLFPLTKIERGSK